MQAEALVPLVIIIAALRNFVNAPKIITVSSRM